MQQALCTDAASSPHACARARVTCGRARRGQGVLELASGARYEGDFVEGAREGFGELVFPAGTGRYCGSFSDGQQDGWGEMAYANGDRRVPPLHLRHRPTHARARSLKTSLPAQVRRRLEGRATARARHHALRKRHGGAGRVAPRRPSGAGPAAQRGCARQRLARACARALMRALAHGRGRTARRGGGARGAPPAARAAVAWRERRVATRGRRDSVGRIIHRPPRRRGAGRGCAPARARVGAAEQPDVARGPGPARAPRHPRLSSESPSASKREPLGRGALFGRGRRASAAAAGAAGAPRLWLAVARAAGRGPAAWGCGRLAAARAAGAAAGAAGAAEEDSGQEDADQKRLRGAVAPVTARPTASTGAQTRRRRGAGGGA